MNFFLNLFGGVLGWAAIGVVCVVVALGWMALQALGRWAGRQWARLGTLGRDLRTSDLRGPDATRAGGIGGAYRESDTAQAWVREAPPSERARSDAVAALRVPCGGLTGADALASVARLDAALGTVPREWPYGATDGGPLGWRGTGQARQDRDTVIEATWQGRGKGFAAGLALALAAVASLALSACSSTPAQQQNLAVAGLTLAAIAAQNNTTVANVVNKGALFCQLGGGGGIVAVINAAGAPVTVKDQSAAAVAAACMAFQAIPVAPPADPASVGTQTMPSLPAVVS